MKRSNTLLLALVLIALAACGPSREKTTGRIEAMEKSLFSPDAVGFNQEKADSLTALYAEFIKQHPADSLSPGYLFKSANIVMNSGNGAKALELFDQYMKEYPDEPKAPLCLFFKAFIYENNIGNLDKARETYLLFIEKYPSDDFVKDAKLALVNLGKTPEMIVREFEAKNRADSIRAADSLASLQKKKKRM